MARTQLFCLPYAGGNANFYTELAGHLRPDIAMTAIEYKGHGTRLGEDPCTTMDALMDDVYTQMRKEWKNLPFALLGYSMGATAAYHLYSYLADRGLKPKHLFFMANIPPYVDDGSALVSEQDDDTFLKEMVDLGGLSKEFLDCPELVELFLPILKADVWLEEHSHVDEPSTLDCNMTVLYSEQDNESGMMREWGKCAGKLCSFQEYPGDHFFLLNRYQDVAEVINRSL